MLDEALERFLLNATQVPLPIDEDFAPDLATPEDYRGLHLVAIAYAKRLVLLRSEGRIVRELSDEQSAARLHAAIGARRETVHVGVDTAIGRPTTILRLRVDHARGTSESVAGTAVINHDQPHALPPH